MKKNLFNIVSSGLQAIAVQILGVAFFYILSVQIAKEDFGIIGWANAVSMFVVTVLSFGMEQVVVRRVASSKSSNWAAGAYLFHAFAGSVIMLLSLLLFSRLAGSQSAMYSYLPLFFTAQAITYITTPLKQFLNAKQKFTPYAIISLISNIGKVVIVVWLLGQKMATVENIALVLIVAGLFELVALAVYLFYNRGLAFSLRFKFVAYRKLIKESLPQYMSVIFDSSLSRMDWILLGIFSTKAVMADYSFAYRAYELAKLPLIVIGPIILAKYSRAMVNGLLDKQKTIETNRLLAIELFIATMVLMIANRLWTPVISSVTHGKYGDSNALMFFLISMCLPFHFYINLLWTLHFSAKRYRQISKITMLIAIVNLGINAALIPILGGVGAAVAYLSASAIQAVMYTKLSRSASVIIAWQPLVYFPVVGAAVYFACSFLPVAYTIQLLCSLVLFVISVVALRLLKKSDLHILQGYLKK